MKLPFFKKQDNSLLLQELQNVSKQAKSMELKLIEVEQQLQKSTRLQYKTGKILEEKLDKMAVSERNESSSVTASTIMKLIQQIDDMDVVYGNLKHDHQLKELIKKWTDSLIATLGELGVYDSVRLGDTFDPAFAEAIETVDLSDHYRPFEIVKVYTRTFVNGQGSLIRKGQVLTVKEEK